MPDYIFNATLTFLDKSGVICCSECGVPVKPEGGEIPIYVEAVRSLNSVTTVGASFKIQCKTGSCQRFVRAAFTEDTPTKK